MDIEHPPDGAAGTFHWLHALDFDDLPPPVVRQAKRCLLDLLGVAAAGRASRLASIAADFAAGQLGGSPGARILFDGRRASPSGAAFAGANALDSFDAHDGHALTKGHAGVAVLPAVLALADGEMPVDGRELLTSIVMGYEVATRAGIALHASACDYHTSGAWNALASAAVGARHLRLDATRTREALGIAEYHGPRSQMMRCIAHPTMVKDGSGWGALAGVSAAYLARDGFTGAPAVTVEDGTHATLWGELGRRWRILEQYFKPHPVCRWAQPAMEAAANLLRAHRVSPSRIMRVEVRTFAEAAALTVAAPRTTEEAQYSLPFPLAALLVHGVLGTEVIANPTSCDDAVLRLARRVSLAADPQFSARFPAERLAQVTLRLDDGTALRSEPTAARGDPDSPLPDTEISGKFHRLAGSLAVERRQRIEDEVDRLDRGGNVAALLDAVLEGI